MKLKEGIYEQVISNKIHEEIKNRENEINIQKEEIEKQRLKQTNRTLQSNNKLPINTSRRRRNKRK